MAPSQDTTPPREAPVEAAETPGGGAPEDVRVPPHRYRLAALAVDLSAVTVTFGVLALFGGLLDKVTDNNLFSWAWAAPALLACLIVVPAYTAWLTGGTTLGKALFGLVERRIDGRRPDPSLRGLAWALGRHSAGYLVVDMFGIGALAALFNRRRRCLHDYAFASEVVYVSTASATPMPWARVTAERFEAFARDVEVGSQRAGDRYRALSLVWKVLDKLVTKVAVVVFAVAAFLLRSSGKASATVSPGTQPVGDGPAGAGLTGRQEVGLWTTTSAVTAGLTAVAVLALSGPDLTRINVAYATESNGRSRTSEIHVMHADGSEHHQLTHNNAKDSEPDLFADRRVVFVSDRDGNDEIYVMDFDGSHPRRLTDDGATDRGPRWSPDGERIAFTSDREGSDDIYVMDANGGHLRRLDTHRAADRSPSWSPDGRRIAFVSDRDGNDEIYVMDANGGRVRRLTHDDGRDAEPAWSPDGRLIAFTSDRDGNLEIYVMDANGGHERRLTHAPGEDRGPFWSPDSRQILFGSNRGLEDRPHAGEIWAMDTDGGGLRQLTTLNER